MNTYEKYCPNVWVAKCEQEHKKGDVIPVANKYGKESDCEVHNLVAQYGGHYYYSITRCDGINKQTYAERKAEKYRAWEAAQEAKSSKFFEQSREGADFLVLAEPIKVGHHSEKRHRALIERNHARMDKALQASKDAKAHAQKAAYWASMADKIDLSMPESVEYFQDCLERAVAHHEGLKNGSIKRPHDMALQYSSKKVKDLRKAVETAKKLWG